MDAPADPDCYWVEPGRFLAGEYPGAPEAPRARAKLRALLECGIRTFVDLTESDEGLEPYDELLQVEAATMGVTATYTRLPIPDVGVPDEDSMRTILDTIGRAVDGGLPVYVHCWGGLGRTGTVVGCWLAERGLAEGDVLETLVVLRAGCAKRRRRSPETSAQDAFVRAWAAAHVVTKGRVTLRSHLP